MKDKIELIKKISIEHFKCSIKIDEHNEEAIHKIIHYATQNKMAESEDFKLSKGILLCGGIGTGKTLLMGILSELLRLLRQKSFKIYLVESIIQLYSSRGAAGIDLFLLNPKINSYGFYENKPFQFCIDDLGLEKDIALNYGAREEVMQNILLTRYEVFKQGIMPFATTNLNTEELRRKYGERIYSRMREMFNIIVLDANDRR